MFPNLLGQKAYYKLTDKEMGEIIGVSRTSYGQKIRSGRFWPEECKKYCEHFEKSFEFLFYIEEIKK